MPGGLLQIISIGRQDSVLIENPEITFFKTVYKKPTLFSIENHVKTIEITNFNQNKDIPIPHYGDLLKNLNIKLELPSVEFSYEIPINELIKNDILSSDIYTFQINSIYYNINELKAIELLLYNNIRKIARLTNNYFKYNKLTKINDSLIYLKDSSNTFDLLYDEIALNHNLEFEKYDNNYEKTKITSLSAYKPTDKMFDKNNVLFDMIYQTNVDTLLTNDETVNYKNMLNDLNNLAVNLTGNNVQNYDVATINNIKLEITNIIESNHNLFLYYVNISKYLEGIIYKQSNQTVSFDYQINVFDNVVKELIKNLQYAIIQLDEIYSYHQIITAPSIDIKHLNFNTNNMYYLATTMINYPYSIVIIINNDGNTTYQTMTIKKILYLIRITSNNAMIMQAMDLFDTFNLAELSTAQFITCADMSDNLINYTTYTPIKSITPANNSELDRIFNAEYIFNVIGNVTGKFTVNKLAFIYSNNLSTLPYDYYYNKLENDQFYYPLAVYMITSSVYNNSSNITSIYVKKMQNQLTRAITTDDKIYIKDNHVLPILNMTVATTNTDVINDYNAYLASGLTSGLSDSTIQTNLQNLLLNCIKYNNKYLMISYQNIFSEKNFLSDLLEIFVVPSNGTFLRPTISTQNINISTVSNIIANEIMNNFAKRDINDIGYNHYNEYIKSTITSLIADYQKLTLNYHNTFYNLGNTKINNILKLIAKLTTSTNITVSNVLSNIKLKTTGYTQEYMIIHSPIAIGFTSNDEQTYGLSTNSFTLTYYINDLTNQTIKYNRSNMLGEHTNKFKNPTNINIKQQILHIVDDATQIYKLSEIGVEQLLHDPNKYTEIAIKSDIMPWSKSIELINTNFEIIQSILIDKKNKFIIERAADYSKYHIYYVSDFGDVLKYNTDVEGFNPISLFSYNDIYFASSVYYYVTNANFNRRDRVITTVSNINNLSIKNLSKLQRTLIHKQKKKYFHYQFYDSDYNYDSIYTIITDKPNKLLYVMLEVTSTKDTYTNIIHLNNLIYNDNDSTFRLDANHETNIITFEVFKIDNTHYNLYSYFYDVDDDKYYFDEYIIEFQYSDIYYKLTFIKRTHVVGDFDIPIDVYKFDAYYYELYKHKIIKRLPDVNNTLNITVSYVTTTNANSRATYNDTYMALYYDSITTVEVYKLTDLAMSIGNTKKITGITSLRSMDIDCETQIIGTINGITYTANNQACYLYILNTNNTIIVKIIYVDDSNVLQIVDHSIISFDVAKYSNVYSVYRDTLNPMSNNLHIMTDNNIIMYDMIEKKTNLLTEDNTFIYFYDTESIILSDHLNIMIIHDVDNKRVLTCSYILESNNIFNFTNISSFNYIANNNLKLVINRVTNVNFAVDANQYILFIDDSYINLFKYNVVDKIYDHVGYKNNNNFLNVHSVTYNDDNELIFITNIGSDINVNSVTLQLSDILSNNLTFTTYVINDLYFGVNYSYQLYSNDAEIFLLYTDTNIDSYNTSLIQLTNKTTTSYDALLLIDNNVMTQFPNTIPYVSKMISLENINEIKILENNNILVCNNGSLYYIYGTLMYKLKYTNVVSIDNFLEYVYIYTSNGTVNTFYVINTFKNITDTYNIAEPIFPITKFQSMRSIDIIDHVMVSNANNIYIYKLSSNSSTMTHIHARSFPDTIKSISLTIYEYVENASIQTMMILFDTFTIASYQIDLTNVTNKTNFIQIYAKPYFIVDKPIGSTYVQMPDVNYPYLHTIEYSDGKYNEYIMGQERSTVKLTLDPGDIDFPYEPQNQHLYKVIITYELETNTPFSKDVRSLINDYTIIKNIADPTITVKYVHNYLNANKLTTVDVQLLFNNTKYDLTSDFVLKQNAIYLFGKTDSLATKPDKAYSTKDITPTLSINKNYINDIAISLLTNTNQHVNVVYNTDIENYNTYNSETDVIYCGINEFIPITYTNKKVTQQFEIITFDVSLQSAKGYYTVSPTFTNYSVLHNILTISYTIQSLYTSDGVSGYVYIQSNSNMLLAKIININASLDRLEIYYKLLDKVNYNLTYSPYYTKIDSNSITYYNKLTTVDITYSNDVNYYNANVILLDYMNYMAQNIKELNSSTNNTADNLQINNDIYNIVNNEFTKQAMLLKTNDLQIINSNDTHHSYNIGFGTGFTNPKPLYIKLSHNFNNMVGYVAINNNISVEIVKKYLKPYNDNLKRMFSNSNDYILNKLQIINMNYGQSAFITWDIIGNKNVNEIIAYIYKYMRELIVLANKSDKYDDFLSTNLNSSYFLISNLNNFKVMYDNIIDYYELAKWDDIRDTIYSLNDGMNKIMKLLHGKFITNGGIDIYLLNKYFVSPINTYNNLTYFLNELDDNVIINYLSLLLTKMYNNYEFNIILDIQQSIIDLYYNMLNTLFNGTVIGTTTYKNINKININYNVNMNNIYNNKNLIPIHNLDPFIQASSNGILALNDITTYLANKSDTNTTKIAYYKNNGAILNLSKLSRKDVFSTYRTYLQNKPMSTIISNGAGTDTIIVTALYDINVGDIIGFYTNKYATYVVSKINYDTNTITLENANLQTILTNTPILIGIFALKLDDLSFNSTIVSNDERTITVKNLRYVEIGQYVGFNVKNANDVGGQYQYFKITEIDYVNKKLTLDLSNKFNSLYPNAVALPINGSKNETVLIGYTFNKNNSYLSSVYSSPYIAEILCSYIFNSFDNINNVSYDSNNKYWNYVNSDEYVYFKPYGSNDKTSYDAAIQNNMNNLYKINDIEVLSYAFIATFTKTNKNHTIDKLLSTFTNIIDVESANNATNKYYKIIFLIYLLNTVFTIKNDVIFENFVNEFNIEKIFKMVGADTLNKKNAILKLANQKKYNYDVKLYDYVPIYESKQLIHFKQYELLLENDVYNDHTFPYTSTANFNELNINLARILQLKTNTLSIKINDILSQLEQIKNYYNDADAVREHIMQICMLDELTKKLANDYLTSKMLLENEVTFDIYNSKNYLTSITFEGHIYQHPIDTNNESLLYNRDVIMDKYERAGYFRLVFQQLLTWFAIKQMIPNIKYADLYYRRLPNNIIYNNHTDCIDTLSAEQMNNITYILDIFTNYYKNITVNPSTIKTDIVNLLNMIDISDVNTANKWHAFINILDDKNLTFDYCSKMVLPCHPCYLAYSLNKIFTKSTYNSTKFVYSNAKYKKDLNNYTIKKYTLSQHVFLVDQKNKETFNIVDWLGEIDGVPKVYLCNRYELSNEFAKFAPHDNNIGTFSMIYMLLQLKSGINIGSDKLTLFNYLLMTILNENMNYVESKIQYNNFAKTADKYPTLYLINGKLNRITNLPDELYYDIIPVKGNTSTDVSAIMIKKIQLNKINNPSTITTYNIFQNTINKTLTRLQSEIFTYYNTNNIINDSANKITVNMSSNYAFVQYEYMIINTSLSTNTITINYKYVTKIDKDTYFYIVDGINTYYYFIDSIEYKELNTTIIINTKLSDNINKLSTNMMIYGGYKNIINKIYADKESRYFASNTIIGQYNDYIKLSKLLKEYVGNMYGYSAEETGTNDALYETTYLYKLIHDLIKDQSNIHGNNININNHIDIDKLFDITILQTNDMDANIDILSNVQNQLYKNYNILSAIKNDKINRIDNVLKIVAYPYNEHLPKSPEGRWINYLGHYIFDYFEFYIGDQIIQKITDDYLHIYYQTNIEKQHYKNYLCNIGYDEKLIKNKNKLGSFELHVQIPWFFSNPGDNLPMISLLNAKIMLKLKTKELSQLLITEYNVKSSFINKNSISTHFDTITYNTNVPNLKTEMQLDYIFLEDEERILFATKRHEYLIEQLQYSNSNYFRKEDILKGEIQLKIGMKNCVKDIYWFCVNETNNVNKQYSNYTFDHLEAYNEIVNNVMFFNNMLTDVRFNVLQPLIKNIFNRIRQIIPNITIDQMNISWFNKAEMVELETLIKKIPEFNAYKIAILHSQLLLMDRPLLNHDNKYTNYVVPYEKYNNSLQHGLHAYSFGLKPNDTINPSGSLNMSAMDNVVLKLKINKDVLIESEYINIKMIGRSYNILRIMSGLAACIY